MHPVLFAAYSRGASCLRRNRRVFQLLFGFEPAMAAADAGDYWDWTTLVLKSFLKRYCTPVTSLLDMGTGPTAVLAIYAAQRLHCREVWASDYLPWIMVAAERQAQLCGVAVRCACSNLFESLSRPFDLIVFNAPYLHPERARSLGLLSTPTEQARFDGGEGGYATISRFLTELPRWLVPGGLAALGVNHFHIARRQMAALVAGSSLKCEAVVEAPLVRSCAYLLRK